MSRLSRLGGSGENSQVEKLWRLGVLSPRSGGQNSRPDCRRCRRSARQLSDLELSFLDLFRQFDAADRDCRRVESLEPQHRHNPLFYPAMILLHDIVQIFAGRIRTRRDMLLSDFSSRMARCEAA